MLGINEVAWQHGISVHCAERALSRVGVDHDISTTRGIEDDKSCRSGELGSL